MIFDVKMEYFRHKARLAVRGHVPDPPDIIRYASVVYRNIDRIALTLADLNDLKVKVADTQNA